MGSSRFHDFGYTVIPVEFRGVECPVVIGHKNFNQIGQAMKLVAETPYLAIVADARVADLYGAQLLNILEATGFYVDHLFLPIQNKDKVLKTVERIYRFFTKIRADWGTTVLLMGGNVLIDAAGFASATFCRGLRYVLVPTTLLSQVDGAIGGAIGVHYRHLTNYIGARRQPLLVWSDIAMLSTLPEEELRAGMAEVVKQAVVADAEMFENLEQYSRFDLRQLEFLEPIIMKTVQVKSRIIERSEEEVCLNYGHTIGLALESVLHHQEIRHGEGVAIGMVGEMRIAEQKGIISTGTRLRLEELLHKLNLPVRIPQAIVLRFNSSELLAEKIWRMILRDKKMVAQVLRWVLPNKIGGYQRAEVEKTLVLNTLMELATEDDFSSPSSST